MALGNSDVCFDVSIGGARRGTAQISRGSIEFVPSGSKTSGYRCTWNDFVTFISQAQFKAKVKKAK